MLCLVAALCCLEAAAAARGGRVVPTRQGGLQGTLLAASGRLPRAVERYLGVPYATPPLGAARLGPTRAPAPWGGVRAAARAGPACPQRPPPARRQSEDCLHLNVFAPAAGAERVVYPVLVLLHGEDFTRGSAAALDGSVLASVGGLVVVTLDYRLGPLGFLNANPAPRRRARVANYGLMDQMAALHWVQDNIAQFGGDPDNVTLMGHGAGAACVHFLISSPAVTPGLFHRAVLLSGSAFSSWALVHNPSEHAVSLARQLNCSVPEDLERDHEDIVDCIRDVPLEKLLQVDVETAMFVSAWGPSVDGVVVQPLEEWPPPRGQLAVLLGVTTAEDTHLFSEHELRVGFDADHRDQLLRAYVRAAYSYHLAEIFYTVSNEYTEWERTALHPANTRDATIAALSDARYVAPVVAAADLFAGGPAYFCVFDHPQRPADARGQLLRFALGAPLADGPANYTRAEAGLSESLIAYLASFAASGDPNPAEQDAVLPVSRERSRSRGLQWQLYEGVHQRYLELGLKPRVKTHYRAHQLSVWLRLVPELERAGLEAAPPHGRLADPAPEPEGGVSPAPSSPGPGAAPTCAPAALGALDPPPPPPPAAPLGLAVAAGCGLLALNLLVCAGACRRRPRAAPAAAAPARQGVVAVVRLCDVRA
ncbi:neuroligin-2-like [Bacillus rossius redtenbacheri]|uniref:neuroligin-2-like n=1 Tax=Bacillus rossius redtenbacheri TaxID=93214 RepID=UPI002FDCAA0C